MPSITLSEVQRKTILIWHGINDALNLQFFLKSSIVWGEIDVRYYKNDLVCRHDAFETRPLAPDEALLKFDPCIGEFIKTQKGIKIDVKEGGPPLRGLMNTLKKKSVPDKNIIFNVNLLYASLNEIKNIHEIFPDAIIQTPIPLVWMRQEMPEDQKKSFYDQLKKTGIQRLSISWRDLPTKNEIDHVRQNGFSLNLYHVETPNDIQKALIFAPETLTSDLNIPEWGLHGRGSGEKKTKSLKGLDKHFVKKGSS
ncbi:MAG: hypothetical protein A3I75_05325 [Deltaproteobacteria bacterium RIFCSPLOWO2_02_FULL_50_16]|nr:MAG: hypothetical protein A2053_00055 [Deltaproteobacteria bacterium GWA2_50_8]OGQ30269.1 MAG: hypothetical protein A3B79_03700 [Deltaproteobacteria bacterium RIFCSPHIGHO2_02_FULL_50_15]OGQ57963.1 MAG: hypothetical protein A3I75_05325 [Deltaproteobacteria bacterium RIFCSPLOWO2_02_FULL_50_16]OGQ66339.1 MAG: hypothetical protein A3F89_01830 [Deltaproteobacteria bacterium RIFCSPLOWO2_12_FULL_50_11]